MTQGFRFNIRETQVQVSARTLPTAGCRQLPHPKENHLIRAQGPRQQRDPQRSARGALALKFPHEWESLSFQGILERQADTYVARFSENSSKVHKPHPNRITPVALWNKADQRGMQKALSPTRAVTNSIFMVLWPGWGGRVRGGIVTLHSSFSFLSSLKESHCSLLNLCNCCTST